ncbi:MAG: SAM-dependent methyltransferase, partial [Lachnospiraceae bacterium]|nr:SAM-dependent methyltransferase [Lachnospiraceae bacterium]
MERIKKLLTENLNETLISLTVSRPRHRDTPVKKLKARPVLIRDELLFQLTSYRGTQVMHENLSADLLRDRLMSCLREEYAQLDMETDCIRASALINRKGGVSLKVKSKTDMQTPSTSTSTSPYIRSRAGLSHNRSRNYIINEGEPAGYLIDLGVMTVEGKIINSRYDKFRQINRFLEYIEDVADSLPTDREARIIDFGCGKSYLTFAIYHYLGVIRGMDIRITGLDLKEDVIVRCNELAGKYGYEKLKFVCGDIADYDIRTAAADMVVTLHACDTATDYALYNAVRWGAGVILSVPCCQHEVNA